MEKFFRIREKGSNIRTEIIAGLTTFFTMAYIIFVNPDMLSLTGMSWQGVFVATVLAAVVGTLMMAFVANLPYAQASGMGLNALFTYTVCFAMGFHWREALAMVLICGLIGTVLTISGVRRMLIVAIPQSLQYAIGGGIGLFISYIGIKNAGFLKFTSDVVMLPPDAAGGELTFGLVTEGKDVIPALVNFTDKAALLALIGLVITVLLMLFRVKGAILLGIIATAVVGIPMGLTAMGEGAKIFDLQSVGSIKDVAFGFFGQTAGGKMGIVSLFTDHNIFLVIIAILTFLLTDIFDTIGTLIGTGRSGGLFGDKEIEQLKTGKGFDSSIERALFSDLTATTTGAMLGTSNVTTYVESAAGISVGGRTGLTSVATAICFILCLPFAGLVGAVPAAATAPALIVVGILMSGGLMKIKWNEFDEALPAFLTVAVMPFAYSITYGIAAGFIFYTIVKMCRGKFNEVHPILYGVSAIFLVNFIFIAIQGL